MFFCRIVPLDTQKAVLAASLEKNREKSKNFSLNFQNWWKFFCSKKIVFPQNVLRTGILHFWQSSWKNSPTSSKPYSSKFKNIPKLFLKKKQFLQNFYSNPWNAVSTNLAEKLCPKAGNFSINFRKMISLWKENVFFQFLLLDEHNAFLKSLTKII